MPEKRILLVEDDPDVRFMLTHVLLDQSYLVDAASSVAEAQSCLARERYDLVISDWRLPDGDGLAVADEASGLGAKTIVISGYLFHIPAAAQQRHEFLMKPMRPAELVRAVQRALGDGEPAT